MVPAGRISVAIDVHHDSCVVHAEPLLHGANDPQVGLMGHNQRQVFARESISFEHFAGKIRHAAHRVFEDLSALLMDVMHLLDPRFRAKPGEAIRRRA